MSSYNGEKYIEKQVDSILAQRKVDVSLLIRDDGSKDSTPGILRRLEEKDKRIKCILEDNIGVKKSFLKLVQLANSKVEYYAFSDQDDIWIDNKLQVAVDRLSKESDSCPLIYGSAVSLYLNGKILGEKFKCPQLDLGNFLIKNYYPGCTMLFNRKLKKLIDKVDYDNLNTFPLHDHWLNLVCTACGGKVIIDQASYVMYRQHESNVIGDRNILQKIKGNGLLTHSDNIRLKICQELHSKYKDYEDEKSRELIKTVLDYSISLDKRFKLAFSRKIKPVSKIEKILIFLITVMGKY
jgi:glycosyltransferase involved in cell wall biosynthesis